MVAMLLTSIMVTTVFSVALTVKTGGSKGENKLKAAAGARQIAVQLKNYVTGDPTLNAGPLRGPGLGANSWSMTGGGVSDTCSSSAVGPPANCYALALGNHNLSGVMGAFESAPWNARIGYVVAYSDTVNGRPVPSVIITTTWTEP